MASALLALGDMIFESADFDDHEHVSFHCDPQSGLRAIIAIHSAKPSGTAGGGCRVWSYENEAAALRDVLRLSKAMTYKLALAGLPAGGAKAVVLGPVPAEKRGAQFRALGRVVHQLGGRYIIAEDVGTTPRDMQVIAEETPFVVGQRTDTGPTTAYGVLVGLRTAVARRLDGRDLRGLRVAVQGVGAVGYRLCAHLARAEAVVTVCDIDAAATQRAAHELGVKVVAPEAIYDCDVDVFAPCALGAVIDDDSVERLRCAVIAGSANNQLGHERHGERLQERGILYAPDFVINAGGLFGAAQEAAETAGAETQMNDYVREQLERIGDTLTTVLDRAEADGVTPHEAAVRTAKEEVAQW